MSEDALETAVLEAAVLGGGDGTATQEALVELLRALPRPRQRARPSMGRQTEELELEQQQGHHQYAQQAADGGAPLPPADEEGAVGSSAMVTGVRGRVAAAFRQVDIL